MDNNLQQSFTRYVEKKNAEKEKIDLYDKDRNYIRTIYRGEEINKNEWKKCILCFVVDRQGNVIVEYKRNGEKDGCSGHIKQNEVATQAVLRELYEELKIEMEESLNAIHLGNIAIDFEETEQKLQCFLNVYCLFRTKDTPLEPDVQEIEKIERMPIRKFLKEFISNEIFPCVEGYIPIIEKFVKLYIEEIFEKSMVTELEI